MRGQIRTSQFVKCAMPRCEIREYGEDTMLADKLRQLGWKYFYKDPVGWTCPACVRDLKKASKKADQQGTLD